MRYEKLHVRIDDATISEGDPWAVIHPVWYLATIFDGPTEYERSLKPFSRSQRYIFALQWYIVEVNNGGHEQFYSNSTGVVWRDALEACRAVEALGFADILMRSADRLGGSPSQDREVRSQQLTEFAPDFNDLDYLFFKTQPDENVDDKVMSFIRSRPSDFYFDGTVEMPVRPGS